MSRTPSATVCGGSSSRISSRTVSSTSVSAVKSKSMPSNSTRRGRWSGFERLEQGAEIGFVQVADQPRKAATSPASIARVTCRTKAARIVPSLVRSGGALVFWSSMPASAVEMRSARRLYASPQAPRKCLSRKLFRLAEGNRLGSIAGPPRRQMIRALAIALTLASLPWRRLAAMAAPCPGNPDALGTERVLDGRCRDHAAGRPQAVPRNAAAGAQGTGAHLRRRALADHHAEGAGRAEG